MGRETATGNAIDAEDLTTFAYESTWRMVALPRTESFVSLAYLPSQSPSGGLQGAVAPAEIFYHQTTYLAPYLTIRSGVGLVRFGPGDMVGIPTQTLPITSAGARPLGFGDIGYEVSRKLTVDFAVARNAITYTPVSTRLGVMEDRVSLGIDYRYDAKTEVRLEPYANEAFTASYGHVEDLGGSSPASAVAPTTTVARVLPSPSTARFSIDPDCQSISAMKGWCMDIRAGGTGPTWDCSTPLFISVTT